MTKLTRPRSAPEILDVLGIGFGPSNIAMAIALRERGDGMSMRFLEARDTFAWHPGMLFNTARMQVSFLKDLVSFRNPCSEFTFLNYLHKRDRLADFANLNAIFPTRAEFSDYLSWCVGHFTDVVRFGYQVTRVEPAFRENGKVTVLRVIAQGADGEVEFLTRSVVHAGGLQPTLPPGVTAGKRIFHNSNILYRLSSDPPEPGSHYVVLGAGQSAAEVVEHLHGHDLGCRITSVLPRFGFVPADNSPFVNQIFDPESVDLFYETNSAGREKILTMHRATNYGAVDLELIQSLYSRAYQERVVGQERLSFDRLSTLHSAQEDDTGVELRVDSLMQGSRKALRADYLVCATGYAPRSVLPLLNEELCETVVRDEEGRPHFSRQYALDMGSAVGAGIYSVGMCEHSHGLSATLISNMATRSGEIVEDIAERLQKLNQMPSVGQSARLQRTGSY